MSAAHKRDLIQAASLAGLRDPGLVSTSPIQSPHSLKALGLLEMQPYEN